MRKREQLVAFLDYRKSLSKLTDNDLARLIGGSKSKYAQRKEEPCNFRLEELQKLAKALKFSIVINKDGSVEAYE